MILTNEEIEYWIGSNSTKQALCRAIQSAVIAKLSQGVDMSKPYSIVNDELVYSFDQVEMFVAASRIKTLEDAANFVIYKSWSDSTDLARQLRVLKGD